RSWAVVREPNAATLVRERALRQAREACRLKPDDGVYLMTLGVALYRSGEYEAALEALSRSEKINTATGKVPNPIGLAFLAMAQHRLGKPEAAKQTLARLRQAANDPRWTNHPESQSFAHEAERLLQEPSSSAPK